MHDQRRMFAMHAAWTLQPYAKNGHPIRPEALLGEQSSTFRSGDYSSVAEMKAAIRARQEGGRGGDPVFFTLDALAVDAPKKE